MEVARKDVFDFIAELAPKEFAALKTISDKRSESVERAFIECFEIGFREFITNYDIKE